MARLKNTRWLVLALLLPAGSGCKLVLGVDGDDHGLGSGGSASGSSSSTSSSGSGGSCPVGEVIHGGNCVASCNGGATDCDGACVDTTTDPANCGACGNTCPADKVCAASMCVAPPCTGPLSFAPAVFYSASSMSHSFALADLNGDGRPDIVAVTSSYSLMMVRPEILVLVNMGDGSFATGVSYPLEHDTTVGIGDLNGDSKPEIVVTNAGSNTLTVLLNKGDGTFAAQPAVTLTPGPSAVSVGDVNGDGKGDVYWFAGATFNALYGMGDGTFAAAPVTTTFTGAATLVAADLNGDGTIDVAFNMAGTSVYVALNEGDGTFPSSLSPYFAMASVTGLSLADWNGDGKPDLLAAGTPYTVLLNGGTGTFQTQFALTMPPAFSVATDMNGDGQTDLVALIQSTPDSASVWLNNGNNTFTTLVSTTVARYSSEVQVGDLNGDGLLDMVSLSQPSSHIGTLSVVLNTCPH
jgi:hypothetical protein